MKTWILIGAVIATPLLAQEKAPVLSLAQYLADVKASNPEARAAVQTVAAMEFKMDEADVPYSPELYSEYKMFNNRAEPMTPFAASETKGRNWKVGIRDQTTFGLKADAYFQSTRSTLEGVTPGAFFPYVDYEQSAMGLTLTQSLWRDSFGDATRSKREATRAQSRADLLRAKFALKNLQLRAENTYWTLASYNEIIKRQEENLERAKRLRDYMANRASLRLFDDVDAMQSEAAYQQRQIELQNSMDARSAAIRQFNTLRGRNVEQLEALEELPTSEFMLKTVNDKSKRMSREDFAMIYEQANAAKAGASSAISMIRPQLDLVGGIGSNGLDTGTPAAYNEAALGRHPNWTVGLQFSIPIDYSLIGGMRNSYQAQKRAAEASIENARFSEERAWDDLLKQNREAQGLFERAIKLEELRTELVKRERQRLLNGRSTTTNSIQIEQEHANSQIERVRAQLTLLQLHNSIKQFEEAK